MKCVNLCTTSPFYDLYKLNPYIYKHGDMNYATKHKENRTPKDPWLEMVTLEQSKREIQESLYNYYSVSLKFPVEIAAITTLNLQKQIL